MERKINCISLASVCLLIMGLLTGCSTKLSQEFTLFYPDLTELCAGTGISVTPTWVGGDPSSFAISGIKKDGETFETDCFSVDPSSGIFKIDNSSALGVGVYSVDIKCIVDGGSEHNFVNAIEITLMKSVPDGITVTPSKMSVKVVDVVKSSQVTLPTALISPNGDGYVKIQKYLIENVYIDGELNTAAKEWFELNPETGLFSIVPINPSFVSGKYTFDFRLTTYKAGEGSQEGLFKNALELDAVSAPFDLVYTPSTIKVEVGTQASSEAPTFKGTHENVKFTIKTVSPAIEGVVINEETGVISIPAMDASALGNTYSISVSIANDYGSEDFENAFTFEVINFIAPITILTYNDVPAFVSGLAFTNAPTSVDGDDVNYSLVDVPTGLESLKIDAATGVVSLEKGNEITPGEYTITVKAKNTKGEKTATFKITVQANPNHFTYVRWGNNLGLTPIEKYGNQFRIELNGTTGEQQFPIVESDIPAGRPVKFSSTKLSGMGNHGVKGMTSDGKIKIAPANSGNPRVHEFLITVTVGEGDIAVTKSFPLFVHQTGYHYGVKIEYTPFAIRVNPQKGGRSSTPTITPQTGEIENPTLDFRCNFFYYNMFGPSQHTATTKMGNGNNFLVCVWDSYYSALGKQSNYGANNPVSYFSNNGQNLHLLGAYIEQGTLQVVVNPDKFHDQYGYAAGAADFTCTFDVGGVDPKTKNQQVMPVVIWLDPDYNE